MSTMLVGGTFEDKSDGDGAEQTTQGLSISPVKQIEIENNLVSSSNYNYNYDIFLAENCGVDIWQSKKS